MKILVVDDSRVMRLIVTRTLRQAGYGHATIVEAEDGDAALALVRSEAPDLVLSDWNMPGTSGLDLLQRVRGSGSDVPFVLVTSEGSAAMRERAELAGADALVAKPFTAEALGEQVDAVLDGVA